MLDISAYVENADDFRLLELEDQLNMIADITLYWNDQETLAWENHGKSSVEAKRCHDRAKYWTDLNQNIKKLAELEAANRRTGVSFK